MSVVVLPRRLARVWMNSASSMRFSDRGSTNEGVLPDSAWAWKARLALLCLLVVSGMLTAAGRGTLAATLAPEISGLSPSSGPVGKLVIVNGRNLVEITRIEFNGVPAPIYGGTDDGSAVQTEVPVGASTGPVRVVTSFGEAQSPGPFEVGSIGPPTITSFSPMTGPAGTHVTVVGSNLVDVTSVTFGGISASFSTFAGLVATVPTNALSGPITVTTGLGSTTSRDTFAVTVPGPPVIHSFTPNSGPPGTFVELAGTNLVHVQAVLFDGHPAQFTDYGSETERHVTATVPLDARTGLITVITEYGQASTKDPFTVTPAPTPKITTFAPTRGRVGSTVDILGEHFAFAQFVKFSGVAATEFTMYAPDALQAIVPYAPTGPITLVTAAGSCTTTDHFTVLNGPLALQVTSLSPWSGPPNGEVVISLTNLFGQPETVLFNGTAARFNQYGSQLVAVVPSFATSGPVTVVTSTGSAVTAKAFEVFRSDNVGVTVTASRDPLLLRDTVVFSLVVTNLGTTVLEELVLTNQFAGGWPVSGDLVVWQDGGAAFGNVAPGQAGIVSLDMSQGTYKVADGRVIWQLGRVAPGNSALLDLEVEPHAVGWLHYLPGVVGRAGNAAVYGSFLRSIEAIEAMALSVHYLPSGQVELTWPISDPMLILQTAARASAEGPWTTVPQEVAITDGHCRVLVPLEAGPLFYRLVQP